MRSYLVILAFLLAVCVRVHAQPVLPFTTAAYTTGKDSLPYRLLYPLHYNKHKRYPFVLFLHGAGQRGTDNNAQLTGVPKALTDSAGREKYPCFILVPQCPKNDVWVKFPHFPENIQTTELPTRSAQAALAILDSLIRQKNNGTHIYTEYAGFKHNIWGKAYSEPGLFVWLFKQRRGAFKVQNNL